MQNQPKNQFFEKENKIKKPFANLRERKRKKKQITKIRDKKCVVITDANEMQTVSKYYNEIYALKNWKTQNNRIISKCISPAKIKTRRCK